MQRLHSQLEETPEHTIEMMDTFKFCLEDDCHNYTINCDSLTEDDTAKHRHMYKYHKVRRLNRDYTKEKTKTA